MKPVERLIPEELGNMTLKEMFEHPDTDIIKIGNKIQYTRRMEYCICKLNCTTDGEFIGLDIRLF